MPFTVSAGARAWSFCGTRTTSRDDLSDHVGTQGTHHLAAPATARSAERHFHACLACPPRETAGQSVVLGAHARRGVAKCAVTAGLQKAVATDADHAQAEPGWQPPDSRLDQRHEAEIRTVSCRPGLATLASPLRLQHSRYLPAGGSAPYPLA